MLKFNRTHFRLDTRMAIVSALPLLAAGVIGIPGPQNIARAAPNAAGAPRVEVSKTAFVNGQDVCGVIRIRNTGGQTVTVEDIVDFLEVHFPSNANPPALPPGSTQKWFKVANVPISLPGPIAPGATAAIDYCFSLCLAADYPGANSMRNVVTVTAASPNGSVKSFTTRSSSFAPPVLDCRACCLPDGSCIDTLEADCVAASGVPGGPGTRCASPMCTQACCFQDGTCVDLSPQECLSIVSGPQGVGHPLGPGTTCATTECPKQCCLPDGTCIDIGPIACQAMGGLPGGPGSTCGLECPQACCLQDNTCVEVVPSSCISNFGQPQGPGTTCAATNCDDGALATTMQTMNRFCTIADLTGDQIVDVSDILELINAWGPCTPPISMCISDLVPPGGDGSVDVRDLIAVMSALGLVGETDVRTK